MSQEIKELILRKFPFIEIVSEYRTHENEAIVHATEETEEIDGNFFQVGKQFQNIPAHSKEESESIDIEFINNLGEILDTKCQSLQISPIAEEALINYEKNKWENEILDIDKVTTISALLITTKKNKLDKSKKILFLDAEYKLIDIINKRKAFFEKSIKESMWKRRKGFPEV